MSTASASGNPNGIIADSIPSTLKLDEPWLDDDDDEEMMAARAFVQLPSADDSEPPTLPSSLLPSDQSDVLSQPSASKYPAAASSSSGSNNKRSSHKIDPKKKVAAAANTRASFRRPLFLTRTMSSSTTQDTHALAGLIYHRYLSESAEDNLTLILLSLCEDESVSCVFEQNLPRTGHLFDYPYTEIRTFLETEMFPKFMKRLKRVNITNTETKLRYRNAVVFLTLAVAMDVGFILGGVSPYARLAALPFWIVGTLSFLQGWFHFCNVSAHAGKRMRRDDTNITDIWTRPEDHLIQIEEIRDALKLWSLKLIAVACLTSMGLTIGSLFIPPSVIIRA